MGTLPIHTQRTVLRLFELDDAPKAFAMSQEPGMRTWIPDQVYADEEAARAVLRHLVRCYEDPGSPAHGPYVLAVALRDTPELIGHVGLSPLDGEVEVGYAIAEQHQGQGLATEAVAATVRWALSHFGLARVMAYVATENIASYRVVERAGFSFVEESRRSMHGTMRSVRTYQWKESA